MSEPYNAAERRHVRAAAKVARHAELATREVIVSLMGSTNGRTWVYGLLERSHVFSTSFSPNALTMAFSEGERNIGLQILVEVTAWCPEQYQLMIQEQYARERAADASRQPPAEPEFDAGSSDAIELEPEGRHSA